jgi:hypothetical protein
MNTTTLEWMKKVKAKVDARVYGYKGNVIIEEEIVL